MRNNQKKIIHLLSNPDFKNWILDPTGDRNLYWEKWLRANPGYEAAASEAREILLRLKFKESNLNAKEQEEILNRIIASPEIDKYKNTRPYNYLIKVAAIFIISLLITYLFAINFSSFLYLPDEQVQMIEKVNDKGVKSQVELPDGTMVYLNSESKLLFPEIFSETERNVVLYGEAFFEVAEDSLRPFLVQSKDVFTKAIGTSFNVSAYSNDSNVNVALVTGQVVVFSESKSFNQYQLDPGEKLSFDLKKQNAKLSSFNLLSEIGWKDGLLVFKNDSFAEFVDKIERWFAVEVTVTGNPNQSWNLDGHFDNESLEEILKNISYTYDLKFELENNKAKIIFD